MTEQDIVDLLKYWHDERGLTWREIANLPDFYGVKFANLNKIYRERKISNPVLRERWGLPRHETCGMCHVFNKYIHKAARKRSRWSNYPIRVLRQAIESREEF